VRDRINAVQELDLTAEELVASLLHLSESEPVCILDSCGVGHLGSHRLIAGARAVETIAVSNRDVRETLQLLDEKMSGELSGMFTLSYDFGLELQPIKRRSKPIEPNEPDLFLALFDVLIYHDYDLGKTFVTGDQRRFAEISGLILNHRITGHDSNIDDDGPRPIVATNFTKGEYIAAVQRIREYIRAGDTYQVNLTQQLRCKLAPGTTPQKVFRRLRRDHPAPFAAFFTRPDSTVISASPERFFRITRDGAIEASPIKGTRPRGKTPDEDKRLRDELAASGKDRAENTMIVDLMRNDLGRVSEYGSVSVEKLCDIEEHPTLFHLVSTVRGALDHNTRFSDILRAVFPCGSITGAPKVRTMQIIEEIEPENRGLSMGAIGCYLAGPTAAISDSIFDVSVAIRTMVARDREVVFNVGGGIVIDSEAENEYDESLLKAKALLDALGTSMDAVQ
jgi:para-aminobenzoate synthetase component 1